MALHAGTARVSARSGRAACLCAGALGGSWSAFQNLTSLEATGDERAVPWVAATLSAHLLLWSHAEGTLPHSQLGLHTLTQRRRFFLRPSGFGLMLHRELQDCLPAPHYHE